MVSKSFKLLVNLSLIAFFLISAMLVAIYFDALYDKIARPTFKNLDTNQFVWLGFAVTAAIFIDFFILKKFVDALKKHG